MGVRTAALAAAIFALVFSPSASAADMSRGHFKKASLEAKIQYCGECHGWSGQGYRGYYPIPRLAGQQAQYLENQFKALVDHRRDNPVAKRFMVPVAETVRPETTTALAEYFSTLQAKPAGGGPKDLAGEGKRIFDEGVPAANVPACAACHGADAKGTDTVPRLAGQMYAYTLAQLSNWAKGYRAKDPVSGEENTMKPIASSMTKEQMEAVAAYVSRLD